jgi:hypothetical protein
MVTLPSQHIWRCSHLQWGFVLVMHSGVGQRLCRVLGAYFERDVLAYNLFEVHINIRSGSRQLTSRWRNAPHLKAANDTYPARLVVCTVELQGKSHT